MKEVEWGEYKIGDLFSKRTIKGIPKSEENLEENVNGYHVYGQNISYQYPQKVLNDSKYLTVLEKGKPIIAYTSSTAQIGIINESFYRTGNNGAFQGLFPKFSKNNFNVIIFILECIKRAFIGFGYNTSMANILDIVIKVPIKNNQINFEFMDSFVAELEAERVAELEAERVAELSAYLKVSGLDNYELSDEELNALREYNTIEWKEYKIGDLFETVKYKKLKYKTSELRKESNEKYVLPALTAGRDNQGLNNYVPIKGATVLKNVISISGNGANTGITFYQSNEFTVLQDAYAIDWKDKTKEFTRMTGLFIASVINNRLHGKYEWTNKATWNRVQEEKILLPVYKEQINFEFIEHYTSAVQKQVIKDVVDYTDIKIEAIKKVVNK